MRALSNGEYSLNWTSFLARWSFHWWDWIEVQLICWPRRLNENSITKLAVTKTKAYSLQIYNRAEDNTHPTYWIGRSWNDAYMDPSLLCSRLLGEGNFFECYWRRNMNTNLVTKLLIYNMSCLKIFWDSGGTELLGGVNHCLILHKATPEDENHAWMLDSAWVAKSKRLGSPMVKQNMILLRKKKSVKCFLMMNCYIHRSVPFSVNITEVFSCSR